MRGRCKREGDDGQTSSLRCPPRSSAMVPSRANHLSPACRQSDTILSADTRLDQKCWTKCYQKCLEPNACVRVHVRNRVLVCACLGGGGGSLTSACVCLRPKGRGVKPFVLDSTSAPARGSNSVIVAAGMRGQGVRCCGPSTCDTVAMVLAKLREQEPSSRFSHRAL